jgi:hypothetical protein
VSVAYGHGAERRKLHVRTTWIGLASKESQSGAQRSNRIIDSAMRDAAPDGNLICVVEIVISSQNGRHQRD